MKREHEPEVVTCTVCDGTGVVLESVVKATEGRCPACRGIGNFETWTFNETGESEILERKECPYCYSSGFGIAYRLNQEIGVLQAQLQLNQHVITALYSWIEYQKEHGHSGVRAVEVWSIVTRALAALQPTEMDVENPISMAYQTVAEVARLKERNEKLEAVLEAAQDVGDDWNGEPQVLTLGDTDVMCAVVSYDPMNMLQNALAAVRDE